MISSKFPTDPTMSQLLTAITTQDSEKFELYAHTLKGVSNNLGLCKLGFLSSEGVETVRKGKIADAFQMFPAIQDEYTRIINILQTYQNEKES